jgi:two-component system, NtrC family, response regulator PilR
MKGQRGAVVANVLYVDDEAAIRRAVSTWLTRKGHTVYTAPNVASAQAILGEQPIDGVFIDLWIGAESGMSLHEWMREHTPALAARVVFVTGDAGSSEPLLRAVREQGLAVVPKPFDLNELARIAAGFG